MQGVAASPTCEGGTTILFEIWIPGLTTDRYRKPGLHPRNPLNWKFKGDPVALAFLIVMFVFVIALIVVFVFPPHKLAEFFTSHDDKKP